MQTLLKAKYLKKQTKKHIETKQKVHNDVN